jgi:hypothetical protein
LANSPLQQQLTEQFMSDKEKDKATTESTKPPPTMKKVVETKEDGRSIIYYSFAAPDQHDAEAPQTGAKP